MTTWVCIHNYGDTKVLKESEYFPAGIHSNYSVMHKGSLAECSIKQIQYKLSLTGYRGWNYKHLSTENERNQAIANDRKYLLRKLQRIYDQYPEYAI